jgi:hypothetical protein
MFKNYDYDFLLVLIFTPIMLFGFLCTFLLIFSPIFFIEISINIINGLKWFSIAGLFAFIIVFPIISDFF